MSIDSFCHFAALLKRGTGLWCVIFGIMLSCGAPVADLSVATLRTQTGTFPYDSVPSRALEDMNPSSPLFETSVAAADFQGQVTVWYFSHATCSYCRSQYVLLDQMQQELQASGVSPAVQIIAINAAAFEAGVDDMTDEGDLPLLQDTETIDLWGLWDITYRDVVVVDATLLPIARINLTTHDLATATTYDALKSLILDVVAHSD